MYTIARHWHETLAHRAKFGSICQTDCFLLPLVCYIGCTSVLFIWYRLQPLAGRHRFANAQQMHPASILGLIWCIPGCMLHSSAAESGHPGVW